MKNGLTSNYCYDVLQDKRGYIWVATLNGLNRFNGNKWQAYLQQSTYVNYKLPANWVIDIDEDSEGNIWINTDRGIAKYIYKKDSVILFANPVKGWGKISCVDNNVFISSWSGIDQYSSTKDSVFLRKHYTGSEENSFTHLFKDLENNLWACPEDNPSLIKINVNAKRINYYKTILLDNKQQEIIINSVTNYTKDTLLLNTKSRGILKYCIRNNRAFYFLHTITNQDDEISCSLLYKVRGQLFLYIGTKNNGLYAVNIKTHKVFHYKNDHNDPGSILSNYITALFTDNNNGLWIATDKGLSFFHPSLQKNKYFYFYNSTIIPANVLINAVCKINSDEFLIGTDNAGLFLYNSSNKGTIKIDVGETGKSARITSFCKLNSTEVLTATDTGLFVYNLNMRTYKKKKIGGKPFNYHVLKVKMLNEEAIAFCTGNGLMLYNLKKDKVIYSELDSNKVNIQTKFCKDAFLKGDNLWILRLFSGYDLYSLKNKTRINYTPEAFRNKPIDYHNISAGSGSLFISTSSGLIDQSLFNKENKKIVRTAQGLQGDHIENVYYSNNRYLYYTTPEGLYKFDLHVFKSNRIVSYENYPQKWYNQLEMSYDSLLIYTISDYFMIYNPFFNFNNKKCPAYVIEQVLVNGNPYNKPLSDVLNLKYNQNNITINLAGLVYPESEKNTWHYKLNTLDTVLRFTGTGIIQLNNLPPDDYTLKVYSSNNEGFQNDASKTIFITINKPFYNTWWFYCLNFSGIVIALFLLFNYRKNQRERLVKIRNQISRDLHDELGANVSSINIMAKMLISKQKDTERVLSNISKYSIQISDTINDIIWNINPKFDSLNELIKKMIRYASESLEGAQINYTIDVPDSNIKAELDNELKYHLYLLFKEAVHNAVKYSNAGLVHISISFKSPVFSFSVKDNGTGFNLNDADKGNGLHNMRSRAKDLHAALSIISELNTGTEIKLTVKLK